MKISLCMRWLLAVVATLLPLTQSLRVINHEIPTTFGSGKVLSCGVLENTPFEEVESLLTLQFDLFFESNHPHYSTDITRDEVCSLIKNLVAVKDAMAIYAMHGFFTTSFKFYAPLVELILSNLARSNVLSDLWTACSDANERNPLVKQAIFEFAEQNVATLKKMTQDLHPVDLGTVLSFPDELFSDAKLVGVFRFMANSEFFVPAISVINFLFNAASESQKRLLWTLYFQHCSAQKCIHLPVSGPITNHLAAERDIFDRICRVFDEAVESGVGQSSDQTRHFDTAWLPQLGLLFRFGFITPEQTLKLARSMARAIGTTRIAVDSHVERFMQLAFIDTPLPSAAPRGRFALSPIARFDSQDALRAFVVELWGLTIGKARGSETSSIRKACIELEVQFPDIISQLDMSGIVDMSPPANSDKIDVYQTFDVSLDSEEGIERSIALFTSISGETTSQMHVGSVRQHWAAVYDVTFRHMEALDKITEISSALKNLTDLIVKQVSALDSKSVLLPRVTSEQEIDVTLRFIFRAECSVADDTLSHLTKRLDNNTLLSRHFLDTFLAELRKKPEHFTHLCKAHFLKDFELDATDSFVSRFIDIMLEYSHREGTFPDGALSFIAPQHRLQPLDPSQVHRLLASLESHSVALLCESSEYDLFFSCLIAPIDDPRDSYVGGPVSDRAVTYQREVLRVFAAKMRESTGEDIISTTAQLKIVFDCMAFIISDSADVGFVRSDVNQIHASELTLPENESLPDRAMRITRILLSLHLTGASEADLIAIMSWLEQQTLNSDTITDYSNESVIFVSYMTLAVMATRSCPRILSFEMASKLVAPYKMAWSLKLHPGQAIYNAITDPALRLRLLPVLTGSFLQHSRNSFHYALDKTIFRGISDEDRDSFLTSFITQTFDGTEEPIVQILLLSFWTRCGLLPYSSVKFMLTCIIKAKGKKWFRMDTVAHLLLGPIFANDALKDLQKIALRLCLSGAYFVPMSDNFYYVDYSDLYTIFDLARHDSFLGWLDSQPKHVASHLQGLLASEERLMKHHADDAFDIANGLVATLAMYHQANMELMRRSMTFQQVLRLFRSIFTNLQCLTEDYHPDLYCHCEETQQLLEELVKAAMFSTYLVMSSITYTHVELALQPGRIQVLIKAVARFIRGNYTRQLFTRYVLELVGSSSQIDAILGAILENTNQVTNLIAYTEFRFVSEKASPAQLDSFIVSLIERSFAPSGRDSRPLLELDVHYDNPSFINTTIIELLASLYAESQKYGKYFLHLLQQMNAHPNLIPETLALPNLVRAIVQANKISLDENMAIESATKMAKHHLVSQNVSAYKLSRKIFSESTHGASPEAARDILREVATFFGKRPNLLAYLYPHCCTKDGLTSLWFALSKDANDIIKASRALRLFNGMITPGDYAFLDNLDFSPFSTRGRLHIAAGIAYNMEESAYAGDLHEEVFMMASKIIPKDPLFDEQHTSLSPSWRDITRNMITYLMSFDVNSAKTFMRKATVQAVDSWLTIFYLASERHSQNSPLLTLIWHFQTCNENVRLHLATQLAAPRMCSFLNSNIRSDDVFTLIQYLRCGSWTLSEKQLVSQLQTICNVTTARPLDSDASESNHSTSRTDGLHELIAKLPFILARQMTDLASFLSDLTTALRQIPASVRRDTSSVIFDGIIDPIVKQLSTIPNQDASNQNFLMVSMLLTLLPHVKTEFALYCSQEQISTIIICIYRYSTAKSLKAFSVIQFLTQLINNVKTLNAVLDVFVNDLRLETCLLPLQLPQFVAMKGNHELAHKFINRFIAGLGTRIVDATHIRRDVDIASRYAAVIFHLLVTYNSPKDLIQLWTRMFTAVPSPNIYDELFAADMVALAKVEPSACDLIAPLLLSPSAISSIAALTNSDTQALMNEALGLVICNSSDASSHLYESLSRSNFQYVGAILDKKMTRQDLEKAKTVLMEYIEKLEADDESSAMNPVESDESNAHDAVDRDESNAHSPVSSTFITRVDKEAALLNKILSSCILGMVDDTLFQRFLDAISQRCSELCVKLNSQMPSITTTDLYTAMKTLFTQLFINNAVNSKVYAAYFVALKFEDVIKSPSTVSIQVHSFIALLDYAFKLADTENYVPTTLIMGRIMQKWIKFSKNLGVASWDSEHLNFAQKVMNLGSDWIERYLFYLTHLLVPVIDVLQHRSFLTSVVFLSIETFLDRPEVVTEMAVRSLRASLTFLKSHHIFTATELRIAEKVLSSLDAQSSSTETTYSSLDEVD